jgi:hypothetical protein
MFNGLPFEILDFLFQQKGYCVRHQDGEWVWVESFPSADLVTHGTPYTRAQAYEDALRNIMGLKPIADERVQ